VRPVSSRKRPVSAALELKSLRPRIAGPQTWLWLEFDLLGDTQSVIDLNAEIAHSAFQLRVSEQKLDRSQIPSLLIKLRCFRSAQGVSPVGRAIEPRTLNPGMDDPRILPRREVRPRSETARE